MKTILSLALSLFAVSAACAKDWPVYPGVVGGMTGPQQITNALLRLSAGDTILVEPGVYDFTGISMRTDKFTYTTGKVYVITNHLQREIESYKIIGHTDGHWNDAIVFKGNGRCIDSQKWGTGVYSKSTVCNITFDGFSCNDYPCGGSLESRGGAMRLTDNSLDNDVISNCVIRNCYAYIGGAVNGGALYDCFITNNYAVGNGGCGCNTYVNKCRIVDNRSGGTYGAIYNAAGGAADSAFINNRAAGGGGAILWSGALLTNCLFRGNVSGSNGGAITMADTQKASEKAVDCRFEYNKGTYGGAVYQGSKNFRSPFERCVFIGNSATYDGGAVYNVYPSFDAPFSDCLFTNNYAASWGGAAREGVYSNCTFVGNAAKISAGAVTLQTSGGVYRCTFVGNVASNGSGGAVNVYETKSVRMHVEDCTFRQNKVLKSGNGGGLNVTCTAAPLPWMLSGCVFEENITSNGSGGGACLVVAANNCSISNCAFTGNVCWTNGNGGAVYSSVARPITDCAFTNNFAWKEGGAVYRGICTNCTFVGNRCVECRGASIYGDWNKNNPYLFNSKAVNCLFIENYRQDNTGRYTYQHTEYQGGDVLGTRMENCEVIGGAGSFWRCSMVNCHLHHYTNTLGHCVFGEESWVTNCLIDHCRMDRHSAPLFYRSHYYPNSESGGYRGRYRGAWVNCTFADNTLHNTYGMFNVTWWDSAGGYGPQMAVDFSNCIFYNNRKANGTLADISGRTNYAKDVTYTNCVYGANDGTLMYNGENGWTDLGGMFQDTNLGFMGARGEREGATYYTPREASPVVGKGDPVGFTDRDVDLANRPRLHDGQIDLGAYSRWANEHGLVIYTYWK